MTYADRTFPVHSMRQSPSFEFKPPHQQDRGNEWDTEAHEIASTLIVQRDRERAKNILLDAQKKYMRSSREHRDFIDQKETEIHGHEVRIEVLGDFIAWGGNRPSKIERVTSPAFQRFLRAWKAGRVLRMTEEPEQPTKDFLRGFDIPQIFLIEHDWGAAFHGSADFDDGDWQLPFPECAFEFQLLSRRVVVLIREDGTGLYCFEGKGAWFIGEAGPFSEPPSSDDELSALYKVTHHTIRALCIALDADVVESTVVRAPSNGRHAPSVEPVAGDSYHVVSLSHRSRVSSLPSSDDEPSHRKRLHFRRGHWRHYDNHKTWIKWMLVGDPDLGFIDKEYRA